MLTLNQEIRIYRDFDEINFDSNSVVTVGTFDGVHLGHQQIIKRLLEIATVNNMRHIVVTIDPHPQIVLDKPNLKPIKLLSTISERIYLLEKYGVRNVFIIPFTQEFSFTSPEAFVKDYILKHLGIKKFLIGYDHMFGKDRGGDAVLLRKLGQSYSFEVERMDPYFHNNILISSTKIRNFLLDNKLDEANDALGYNYIVQGTVAKGERRGVKLGFPTANIKVLDKNKLYPNKGVYLVKSEINGENYFGMANVGTRPTFHEVGDIGLEVNYLDFSGELYFNPLTISFIKYLRDEKKFDSSEKLIEQIKEDEKNCRQIIKTIS
jgi:riboflavin kinase / FMN adenylyltransferase